jgi:hypothetical protein
VYPASTTPQSALPAENPMVRSTWLKLIALPVSSAGHRREHTADPEPGHGHDQEHLPQLGSGHGEHHGREQHDPDRDRQHGTRADPPRQPGQHAAGHETQQ